MSDRKTKKNYSVEFRKDTKMIPNKRIRVNVRELNMDEMEENDERDF